ncbi:MAG: tetratricopeptide repeat protein [Deltaproteobacteria bacterium]|jgi:tetratricopeptide (TPR) repeat protein|nr:tetratricopeptide repeat protein [Deltaproteobacteria bacterium]
MTNHTKHDNQNKDSGPELVPPDRLEAHTDKQSGTKTWLIVSCGLLLFFCALLVISWPLLTTSPSSTAQIVEKPVQPSTINQAVSQSVSKPTNEMKAVVDRQLADWLKAQAVAEGQQILLWGGETYAEASKKADECDHFFREQQFKSANDSCAEALDSLRGLMAAKDEIFHAALSAGADALKRGDSQGAIGHFQQALAIDPESDQAKQGLQRAERQPKVLELVAKAETLQASGRLDEAQEVFAEALQMDPNEPLAQQGLLQTESILKSQQFQQAMSGALQAFAVGNLEKAMSGLRKAEHLNPGQPAVRELRRQIVQAQQAAELANLQKSARSYQEQERWAEALKVCEQALGINAQVTFAKDCREQAQRRIALDRKLKGFLADPERLYDDRPLAEAHRFLEQASNISAPGPKLSSQIEKLKFYIVEAQAEVEVVIRSDGLTEVAIYHVGQLGSFLEKRLTLRTGNYTAIGRRTGYRDVRETLAVRPNSGMMTFTIQCEESI